ncbi:hypothetical protein K9N68_31865 [Kovacikia minuta CCNUW1]|uniref:hypothetical protein n=1 Tax=Kovacikia minuta TaxID=2931930 RepID=UPI001CCF5B77|nr:hypothetical protein [Kovacikia minuta]UBF26079.1 hypothetical protein K9N68_31865 [Kovacikia minuta CCNUW1]
MYRISTEEIALLKGAPLENLEILQAVSAVISHGESQEFYTGFVSALKLSIEMARSHEINDEAFYLSMTALAKRTVEFID